MDEQPVTNHVVRFGVFEADLNSGELRKRGIRVRLGGQPFQVLTRLLRNPGSVVTREELKQELWADDTFVDFENGVNTAIRKIRGVLGDSADTPRYVETLPRRGYRFIGQVDSRPANLAADVQPAAPDGQPTAVPPPSPKPVERVRQYLPWILFSAAGIALLLVLPGYFRQSPLEAPLRKFAIALPVVIQRPDSGNQMMAAISPDGKRLAFAERAAEGKLWVQELEGFEARPLDHTEAARGLFWSPDSEYIGFATGTELKKAAVNGGQVFRLCALPGAAPFNYGGGSWSPDGKTVAFSSGVVMYEVPAQGGAAIELINADTQTVSSEGLWGRVQRPHFLPLQAGRRVLAFEYGAFGPRKNMMVQDLDSGRRELLGPGVRPVYSPNGNSLDLMALPFSLETLRAAGEAFPIAHGGYNASIAADGTLVYLDRPLIQTRLVWLDRAGNRIGETGVVQGNIRDPDLSPDGRRVAVSVNADEGQDLWVIDTARNSATPVTTAVENDNCAAWSPSGEHVAFSSNRGGNADILLRRADGTGEERVLVSSESYERLTDWSWDGKYLLFVIRDRQTASDGWYLERNADTGDWGEPRPFLETPSNDQEPKLSPDGRYVAYVSDLSGRSEVYVESFPGGGEREIISRNGGSQPRWRRDGKELFYVEGETLMAVTVTTTPSFSMGKTTPLFSHPTLQDFTVYPQYDVSNDGQRFILAEPAGDPPKPRIRVVQNWFAEFRK